MILGDFLKKKPDFRTKKLKFFQNIFNKKLKYDKKTRMNKSESKIIKKNISQINKQSEKTYEHYLKVEKELIEYIALLNTRIFPIEKYNDLEMKEVNDDILEKLEYFKKKRIKAEQEDKNELEVDLYKYQAKKEKERTKDLYNRYRKDLDIFKNTENIVEEIKKSLPEFKKLEKECIKLEQINFNLKVKYDALKVEQKCLYELLNKVKIKKDNKKFTLHRNNSCIFKYKTKILNNKEKINSSKISNASNAENKNKEKLFISQNQSNYSKIFLNKNNNNVSKNRCSSAKINNRYNISKMIDENDEKFSKLNKYSIKLLKELNYYSNIKCKELEELCAKEKKYKNNLKSLIELCVEDLNDKYKNEKNTKIKKKLEEKIFILAYIFDNCLKNGEAKELKRQYSMFIIPKKI